MKKSSLKNLVMLGISAMALAACGDGGNNSGTITTINILVFNGTGGKEWVVEAGKRFSQLNQNTSFQDGKVGINFKVSTAKSVVWNTEMKSSGDDIYIYETNPDMYQLAAQKYLLDISDVVEPLVSKIEPDILERLKGPDDKYYGLPHYEWFPGVSYDKDLFDEKCLYFADPSVDDDDKDYYSCAYGEADFIADKNVTKSVGPNGVRGDYDDGLPSSLEEFNILCDKMKSIGVVPLILCGSGHYYSWYLPMAMWASLTGGDGMRDVYCNWTDEEVDVVTGWSANSNLFRDGSGLKEPITTKIKLNDDNGYQMYSMANRYYALAYFQTALKEQWLDQDQMADSIGSASSAQNWFVNGHSGKRYGMLWDGSYWCHEAADVGVFSDYAKFNPSSPTRHTAFMPLPTQLTGQVTEGHGKKQALLNVGTTMVFANAKTARNGTDKAVKEFLKFIYSDSELAAFSEKTGLTVPMEYSYDMSKLDNSYYNDLATLRKDSEVIQCASSSMRFKKNLSSFSITYNMPLSTFTAPTGTQIQGGYLSAFKYEGATADYIFDATKMSQSNWESMSK